MILSFLLSFFLPLIWFYYFYKKDCHPEPILYLMFALFLGIVGAFLSYFVEGILINYGFFDSKSALGFLIFSFIEEFFKFLPIFLLIFPLKVFDEPVDAMIYMMASGFGFAFIENLGYILKTYLEHGDLDTNLVLILRFLSPNLLHILASAIIGFGYAYLINTRRFFPFIFAFIASTILHFIHNFIIISLYGGFLLILPILWTIFTIVLSEIHLLETKYERRISTLKPHV